VADQLADGGRFRALTILDVFTRESLAIAVGLRLRGEDVVATLNEIRCAEFRSFCSVTMDQSSPVRSWICGRITTSCGSTSRGPGSQPTTPT